MVLAAVPPGDGVRLSARSAWRAVPADDPWESPDAAVATTSRGPATGRTDRAAADASGPIRLSGRTGHLDFLRVPVLKMSSYLLEYPVFPVTVLPMMVSTPAL